MMDAHPSVANTPVIRLVLVDADPIFRAGLRAWLKQYDDIQVVEDIGDKAIALRRLQARFDAIYAGSHSNHAQDTPDLSTISTSLTETNTASGDVTSETSLSDTISDTTESDQEELLLHNLVILGAPITADASTNAGIDVDIITLCQHIKADYPTLPILIAGPDDPRAIAMAQQVEANGYWVKTASPETLIFACHQSLNGTFQWPQISPSLDKESAMGGTGASEQPLTSSPPPSPAQSPAVRVGLLAHLRYRLRVEGVQQIDAQLNALLPYINEVNPGRTSEEEQFRENQYKRNNPTSPPLSVLDQWVITGRYRELRAARWLVNIILATPSLESLDWTGGTHSSSHIPPHPQRPSNVPPQTGQRLAHSEGASDQQWTQLATTIANAATSISQSVSAQQSLNTDDANVVFPVPIRANLFDALRDRLQAPLLNHTGQPLEIDILRPEKRRELLVLILHKLLDLLDDLRYSDIQPQQLIERQSQLFYDLWQSILTDYFGKYYVVQVDGLELEVVTILSQDAKVVQASIFERLP
ncbi:MAG: response regulator transcription factor, partial [Symploca sp. SIO2B6]|nr:response regulator transcription factor [Symploca sp. SIO2B6]